MDTAEINTRINKLMGWLINGVMIDRLMKWRNDGIEYLWNIEHLGLTRVSSIQFLLFEIKYNSTIFFYLTDLFILYFFIHNAYADKKYSIIMFHRSKVTAFGILTEPLNPSEEIDEKRINWIKCSWKNR